MKLLSYVTSTFRKLRLLGWRRILFIVGTVILTVVIIGATVEAKYGLVTKLNFLNSPAITSGQPTDSDEGSRPSGISGLFGFGKKQDTNTDKQVAKQDQSADKSKQSDSKKTEEQKTKSSSGTTPAQGTPAHSQPKTEQAQPSAPVTVASTKFGMSAPPDMWSTRLSQVGATNVKYRRIFFQSFGDNLNKVSESLNAGMIPILSWKTGSYSWSQVGSGAADGDLNNLVSRLNAIPGPKILVVHHEPAGDGTAQDYVAMQQRALPILGTANQASVGVIANGWWWSAQNNGYTDAEIAQWIPSSVKNVSDFIAADTYQDKNLVEDGSVKASRMAAWARRTGGVSALGIGEFNGFTAASITNVMNVVKADSLFKWAAVWNSSDTGGLGMPLEGDRLEAFKKGMATTNPT